MNIITSPLYTFRTTLNSQFAAKEPWQIVTITASTVLFTVWLYEFIFQDESKTRFHKIPVFFLTFSLFKVFTNVGKRQHSV